MPRSSIEQLFKEDFKKVRQAVKARLNADLKISFYDLKTGKSYNIAGDIPGWAASMIKVPVMIAAFREIEAGNLSLDDKLQIDHKFQLDPTSEVSYRPQGSYAEVFELLNYMILASCNESTNMLANAVGIPKINETMIDLGCPNTKMGHLLYRGAQLVEPGIDGTYSNTTTPNEMTRLMRLVYGGKAGSKESCTHMRAILENHPEIEYGYGTINDYLGRGLPKGVVIGAKSGVLENDVMETAAINNDYIITIMINKSPSEAMGQCSMLISGISKRLFETYYSK